MSDPIDVPTPSECALQLAAQGLVMELFARIDPREIEKASELYAEDAVFLGATGRAEILEVMRKGLAPNAEQRTRHVIGNVRTAMPDHAAIPDCAAIIVAYTAIAFTLRAPEPPVVRSVLDQQQMMRVRPDGGLEITEQRIFGFAAST